MKKGVELYMDNTNKEIDGGTPTIFHNIIFKDGKYEATGFDPYFDGTMRERIQWMTATHGGKNIRPDDNSIFAEEAIMMGMPPKRNTTAPSESSNESASTPDQSRFAWLGDPSNMTYLGTEDVHQCFTCGLILSTFVQGDTFLGQHAFFTRGECPFLKSTYTSERLKIEIGQERFRRGFVAHPEVITAPDAWKASTVVLTNRIYLTLACSQRCYMCGCVPGEHGRNCYQKMKNLISKLEDGLYTLKV